VLALLVWTLTLPGPPSVAGRARDPGPRDAPAFALGAAGVDAGEWARLRYQAWLRGRAAAAAAERDRAAVQAAADGPGAAAPAPPAAPPAGGERSIPALALRAYREAAAWAAGFDPGCGLSWTVLAGIGRVESNHGRYGGAATRVGAGGTVTPPILGLALDGRGVARIADSDGGRWDGDRVWDRAVGPMQFIPSTWRRLGRDGNHDGVADPNNLFDAATSAAAYLCLSVDGSLSDPSVLRQAIYNYNHSWRYVDAVLGWASTYQGGVTVGPAVATAPPSTGTPAPPAGPPTTSPPTTTTRPPATTTTTTVPPTTSTTVPPTTTTEPPTTTTLPPTTTEPPTTTTEPPTTTTEPPPTTTAPPSTTTEQPTTSTTLPP
jgi:membrane-bound lytic murein transglycosylase B